MSRLWTTVAAVAGLALVLVLSVPLASSSTGTTGGPVHADIVPDAPGAISAFSTGMAASVAIGQPSLTGTTWTTANQTAFKPDPEGSAMAPNGTLWTVDYTANRVMEFLPPYTTGEAASVVIGQNTFNGTAAGVSSVNLTGAGAVAVDAHGNLWVADTGDNRVLEFVPPFRTGMAASLVIGQTTMEGYQAGTTAVNLSYPIDVSVDAAGDLWVTDSGNNRVLEFEPPFSTGMAASAVIGQDTMTGYDGGTSSTNLSFPVDAEMSDNVLWVADGSNDRVVGFPAPISDGESADYLLGQTSFTTTTSTGAASLDFPTSVSSDAFGNLWVSDAEHDRVVEFAPPFTIFETPTVAIGQPTLGSTGSGDTATTLDYPFGALVSPSGDLWVTDAENSRILEYIPTEFPVHVAATGLPAGTSWTVDLNGASETGTGTLEFSETNGSYPLTVTPVAGYRADPSVEWFNVNGTAVTLTIAFSPTGPNPFSVGMAATIVLGQPNFTSDLLYPTAGANTLGTSMFAIAFDASGDLWVADGGDNRVLEYKPPFSNDMSASLVLGQSSFTGSQSGTGATNLSFPDGLAFDPAGDLFVANYNSNRVVEFAPPFTNGMTATAVVGQSTLTGYAAGHGPANLSGPSGIAYFNGSLWVTDYDNNRVLEYPGPITTGESASLVLGQSSLTGFESNTTAVNESEPDGIAFDAAGNAWVADYDNNRVLRYDAPFSTGEAASVVVGQANMTTYASDYPSSTDGPDGVWVDGAGNLWVADTFDNRVLEFRGPAPDIVTNATASEVIGQGNLTTYNASTTATGLFEPTDAVTDAHGNLWVVDSENERVLGYVPSEFHLNFTETGLPASTSWGVRLNGTTESSTSALIATAQENGTFDWTATPVAGYVPTPSGGTATVNGVGSTIAIAYAPFTYTLTFTEVGLPTGTNWSVSIGGELHSSTGTQVVLDEPNGSYAYTISSVTGYSASASSGNVLVSSGSASVTVTFTSTSHPTSTSPSSFPWTDLLVVVVVLAVLGAIVAVLLSRRRKGGSAARPPVAPYTPPPGATGSPTPPPWQETPPPPV